MSTIRVLIADDHAVLRAGLKLLIASQPDMAVVAEAGSLGEASRLAAQHAVDVAILDLTMPGVETIKCIERFVNEHSHTRVLVLTMHDEPDYVRAALAAGATGYVVKQVADVELLGAIRAVAQGRTFVDAASEKHGSRGRELEKLIGPDHASGAVNALSHREREVLLLVAQGHTNLAIADQFLVSVKTVESYRSRLMAKLKLKNRAELVRFAIDSGLLKPE